MSLKTPKSEFIKSATNYDDRMIELVEQMSKNVHEVWAKTCIQQGWKYGEQRSDELNLSVSCTIQGTS
jgi:hypothetical protein